MKKIRALSVLNAVAFLVQITMTWLVQSKLVNESTVGEVSEKYPSLFTPAVITFAIWGIIYITLGMLCIYHMVMAWRRPATHPSNVDIERMGEWFVLANVSAAFWLLSWADEEISLSVILMCVQLLCLFIINRRLGIYDPRRSAGSKFFTQFPLSIYFGWITVTTIANANSYLNSTDWDGWGLDPIDWTTILIGVIVFIAILVMTIRRNIFYGLVIMWALYGIIIKRTQIDPVLYYHILRTAWIGISVLALVAVLRIIRTRVTIKQSETFPVSAQSLK